MEATPEMIDNEESLPDWLKPMPAQEEVGGANKVENEPASVDAPASRVEHEPTEEETFPDWLKSLEPEEKAETDLADTRPSAAVKLTRKVEPTPADEGSFPDWLKHLQGEAEATATSGLVTSAQDLSQSEEPLPPADAHPITEKPLSEVPLPAEPAVQKPVEPIPLDKATENQDFVPSGTAKPLEIGDDALGWLESLAAKQGANADELLTKPQERHEEMPDWLNPNEVQPVTAFAKGPGEITPESLPTTPIDAAGEEVAAVLPPMNEESTSKADETLLPQSLEGEGAQPVRIEDDTMAWLEGLAANQGANPEELLSKPEDRPETAPEWIQNAATEESTQPAEASVMAEAETREVMEPASEEDLTVTTWLSELDKQEGGTDKAVAIPAQEEIPADQGDLPDWLKDMERPTAIEAANEAAVVENKAESDLPDWLRKSTVENEAEQPSITEPISEPAIEEETPPWMEEPEEVAGLASPTAPEEWIPADGSPTKVDVVEVPEQPPVIEPVAPAVVPVTEKPIPEAAGMVAPIPAQNKDAEILSIAQNALENNSLNAAVKEYSKLIKKGHLIEEVIHDLREAVYRFPVDVIIWQTLGDAYMRANHLQDALDAYSKAEELLR
jgi:hypothetical protein